MPAQIHDDSNDLNADIARLESMSAIEIDAELAKHGIDAQQAIDHVVRLVKENLRESRRKYKGK